MARPIIIVLKDDGKITKEQMAQCKEMLEEAVKKAYDQGYEDGKKDNNWWPINAPLTTTRQSWTYGPTDITVSYTSLDGTTYSG